MGNRVFILFCMISALSFLFFVFSGLFLKLRSQKGIVVSGVLWFLMFSAVIIPLFDVFGVVDLRLFVNYTGGLRIEAVNILTNRKLFSDLFIPADVLNAAITVCTVLVTARIASSAAYFSYSFSGYLNNLHFLTKHSEECHDDKIKRIFERAAKLAGLKRNISLRVMRKDIRLSPCTCGIFFPSVYIGKEILYDYDEKRLEFIFLHEIIHIRKHDSALKLFSLFVSSVFWGLPNVKKMIEALYEDAEYRCDAAVIEKTGLNSIGEYMSVIIDIAERNINNDYRGYDFLSPVSRAGKTLMNRYRILKAAERKNRFPFVLLPVILATVISNAVFLSSISVSNISNVGVDLANPLLEKAVCSYFDIDDPSDITEQHIDSIYCLEFKLSQYHEQLMLRQGYYALAVEINEGMVYENGVYVNPNAENPAVKITCDLIEPVIFSNRFQMLLSSDERTAVYLKSNYSEHEGRMYLKKEVSANTEEFDKSVLPPGFYREHITAGKYADTRDMILFNGLRTLIFSDRIKSHDESVYQSDQYAVIERDD